MIHKEPEIDEKNIQGIDCIAGGSFSVWFEQSKRRGTRGAADRAFSWERPGARPGYDGGACVGSSERTAGSVDRQW